MTDKERFDKMLKQVTIKVGVCLTIIPVLLIITFWSFYEIV